MPESCLIAYLLSEHVHIVFINDTSQTTRLVSLYENLQSTLHQSTTSMCKDACNAWKLEGFMDRHCAVLALEVFTQRISTTENG